MLYDQITCSSQCFGDGPVSRVHSGSMLRLRESQDLDIPQLAGLLVWKQGQVRKKQDPVSTMQKTGWTNNSSFLFWRM